MTTTRHDHLAEKVPPLASPSPDSGHCGCVVLLLASSRLHPLDELDAEQRSALYIASWQGHTQCARLLINRRADLELKTAKGLWPLYISANRGHADCVQALLAANAEPDAQTNNAATPLGTACEHGRSACASQLIAAHANVEHTSKFGTTALHWACKRGQVECARLLLDALANPSATNKEGSSPLALAADVSRPALRHAVLRRAALNRRAARALAASSPLHLPALLLVRSLAHRFRVLFPLAPSSHHALITASCFLPPPSALLPLPSSLRPPPSSRRLGSWARLSCCSCAQA